MIGVNTMQFNKQLKENKMKKLFLNLKQSSELQKLGFNEPCFGRYDGKGDNKGKLWYEMPNSGQDTIPVGDVLAPTFSQAFRFFREKYGLYVFEDHRCNSNIDINSRTYWMGIKQFKLAPFGSSVLVGVIELGCYKTYEEAESACLDKLIELAKNVKLK